jgi:hypothetical protein
LLGLLPAAPPPAGAAGSRGLLHRKPAPADRALACPSGLARAWLGVGGSGEGGGGGVSGSGGDAATLAAGDSSSPLASPPPSPLAVAVARADPLSCALLLAAAALDGWAAAATADSRRGPQTVAPLVTPEEVVALLLTFRVDDDAYHNCIDYSGSSSSSSGCTHSGSSRSGSISGSSNRSHYCDGGGFAAAVAAVSEVSAATVAAYVERRAVGFCGGEPATAWSLDDDAPVQRRTSHATLFVFHNPRRNAFVE